MPQKRDDFGCRSCRGPPLQLAEEPSDLTANREATRASSTRPKYQSGQNRGEGDVPPPRSSSVCGVFTNVGAARRV